MKYGWSFDLCGLTSMPRIETAACGDFNGARASPLRRRRFIGCSVAINGVSELVRRRAAETGFKFSGLKS